MSRREEESLIEYHQRLFTERPVTMEAIEQLRTLCEEDECCQIECEAVKCALAYIDGNVDGRGMAT